MPRLFTGVEIPTDVSFDLEMMKGGIIGSRWLDRELSTLRCGLLAISTEPLPVKSPMS